jgi:hypothetical protein
VSSIKVTNLQAPSAASPAIVLASDGSATAQLSSLNGGALSGMRNKIINGNFDVWQRGTSFTLSTSFQYTVDRWRAKVGTGGAGSITRNVSSGDGNPYLTFAITTAGTGSHELSQPIEFVRSVSGTGGASTSVTVSMRVARTSGTGTLDVSLLQYFGSGGSPSASVSLSLGTITPTSTSTLYSLTGTLASITGKTFGSNNDDQLVLIITPSNAVASYDFASVQVEPGSVATPFERRSYGQELALAQRYYYRISSSAASGNYCKYGQAFASATTNYNAQIFFPVPMRSSPTLDASTTSGSAGSGFCVWDSTSDLGVTSLTVDQASRETISLFCTVSGAVQYRTGVLQSFNNKTSYIGFSAEL